MNNRLAMMKAELANILADMMISFRRMSGISEDVLWDSAYKHICNKLDVFVGEITTGAIPVTDLVHLDLPFQIKENSN
jgi:hypothetical protein